MSDSTEDFNVEYKVFTSVLDKIFTVFRSAQGHLCRAFYSKSLVHNQVMCLYNEGNGGETALQAMVTALQDRVKIEPKAYYKIIAVLKEDNSLLYLADMLEGLIKFENKILAEKKSQKLVENKRQFYQDATIPSQPPSSKQETTDHYPRKIEARNVTEFGPAKSGEVESAMIHLHVFVSQAQAICTEEGDSLPISDLGNLPGHGIDCSSFTKPWQQQSCKLKMEGMEEKVQRLSIITGTESPIESESRENYDMLPSLVSHDQMPATPSLDVAKDLLGNEVIQSNTINERIAQESISEEAVEKNREMKHDQGWKEYAEIHGEELSEEENGGAQTWAMESTRSRSSGKSVAFRIPTNIFRHSTSVFSDNSDIFETPRVSVSNSLESSISPREIEKTICSNCEFLCRKVQEQREDFQRQLDFGKQERNKILTYYETVFEQMNMKKKTECLKSLIAEHKEVQKMKREIKWLKKGKEKAEREREWAHQEKEWVEKDLDRTEKELDKAEREIDDERSSRLEKELLY